MANTKRARNSIALAATVASLAAGVAVIAIMVGSMLWFWTAGVVFLVAGFVLIGLAARGTEAEDEFTQARSSESEIESRPWTGTVPPPDRHEGRQPPAA